MTTYTACTPYEAATALELEARRQGKSYGRLVANTEPWQQDDIIDAYMKKKNGQRRRNISIPADVSKHAPPQSGGSSLSRPEGGARSDTSARRGG